MLDVARLLNTTRPTGRQRTPTMQHELMNYTRLMALTQRWMRRLSDANKNRDEALRANAHKALEAIEVAVHEAPPLRDATEPFSDEARFSVPTKWVF